MDATQGFLYFSSCSSNRAEFNPVKVTMGVQAETKPHHGRYWLKIILDPGYTNSGWDHGGEWEGYLSLDKCVPASGWQTRLNWLLILRDLLSGLSQPG